MFMKRENGKGTEYTSSSGKIGKIDIDRSFDQIRFWGDFGGSKLEIFDEGIFGKIKVSRIDILIRGSAVTSQKLKLLNALEEYEPGIGAIREILVSALKLEGEQKEKKTTPFQMSDILTTLPTVPKDTPKPKHGNSDKLDLKVPKHNFNFKFNEDSDDIHARLNRAEKDRIKRENPEAYKDLTTMHKSYFEDDSFYCSYKVASEESYRVVDAQYRLRTPSGKLEENIRRTTITEPGYPVDYIEHRVEPEITDRQVYEHVAERYPAKHEWLIKFNSPEAAKQYKNTLLSSGFSSTEHDAEGSLTLFSSRADSIQSLLGSLVNIGACPESVALQHQDKETRCFRY